MSSLSIGRRALVFSPSASHPQDHGNRNRVFQTASYLRDNGYEIHFILYPYENDWANGIPRSAAEMRNAWSSFTVIPPSCPLHSPAAGEYHLIDEWWDPMIGNYLDWLFGREWFDVFLVNYTFFSKALEFAPKSTVKVLETHDVFTGRKELFLGHGARPEFFYTTAEQEQQGLARADIVIGMKDREAEILRNQAPSTEVISVPFSLREKPAMRRPERLSRESDLRVGFIGALNTVNTLNLQRFLDRLEKYRTIYVPPTITLLVAGEVCANLRSNSPDVTLLGRIDNLESFYDEIDVVVAPMSFSTGLKIKVGEALAHGKAVVATRDGFDGFPQVDSFHCIENLDSVCRAIISLAFDRQRLALLEERSLLAAQLARRRSMEGYERLERAIGRRSKRIVFITDQEIWKTNTAQQARLAQWCELCTLIAPTVIIYVAPGPVGAFRIESRQLNRSTEICHCREGVDEALQMVDKVTRTFVVSEVVISAGADVGRQIWHGLRTRVPYVTLDTWVPELASEGIGPGNVSVSDIWMTGEDFATELTHGGGVRLSTSAFRYLPAGFDAWKRKRSASSVLVTLCEPDSSDALGLEQILSTEGLSESLAVVNLCAKPGLPGVETFAELKESDIPRILLALGRNEKAVEVSRCLAAYWGIACIHVSGGFPCLVAKGSETQLCCSYRELAEYLAASQLPFTNLTAHSGDAGWSTYWRLVSGRYTAKRGYGLTGKTEISGELRAV